MKIKICGLTNEKEAAYLNREHVDYAGMVLFFPKSRRNISLERASSIMKVLSEDIKRVAVTVEPDAEQVRQIEQAGFDYIQIHGRVSGELLECIHIPVLKAFNVKDMEQFEYYSGCPQIAGYVFDAAEPGSGKTFDWSLMERVPGDGKLLLLAGGLCPENVAQALREVKPDGVDVSSGVEYDDMPGKDPEKIMHFVREVRRIDDRLDTGTV